MEKKIVNSKRSGKPKVLVFDVDIFVATKPELERAVFLYNSLSEMVFSPPQYVEEDEDRYSEYPKEVFFVANWPESSRPDLIRDLSSILGEHPTSVSKRLLLIGNNKPGEMTRKAFEALMLSFLKSRGVEPYLYVTTARNEDSAICKNLIRI